MSLYSKRSSDLAVEGVEIRVTNGTPETKAELVIGSKMSIKAAGKTLRVSLSKDGKHLEIELMREQGTKNESVVRMSL